MAGAPPPRGVWWCRVAGLSAVVAWGLCACPCLGGNILPILPPWSVNAPTCLGWPRVPGGGGSLGRLLGWAVILRLLRRPAAERGAV